MSDHILLPLDEDIVAETAANLDLRRPNADALAEVAKHLDAANGQAVEVVLDLATAVGKTYVAAGIIDYAAALGARNFAIVAPSRAILEKTKNNFMAGHPKEVRGRSTSPLVITSDDFTSGSVKAALEDENAVKLFIFTVQQLIRPRERVSRRVRDFQEGLGQGLYNYLRDSGDLVVIADEHHAYYGPAFSNAIRELDAAALVGLTATPDPKTPPAQIIFRYTLGQAIADGLVKSPVLVGRRDARTDLETQLADGVALLNAKRDAVAAYCANTGADPLNPTMFLVCQNIDDANEVADILRRPNFFGEDYTSAVLTVHSEAGDGALDALAKVEEVTSPVRAIVSVSMLKEGWDVKNIFVICALRALASQVLTEQTLGRGLRLPFGKRTDIEMLDTVEVLAHDRYEALLAQAGSLVASLVDDRTSRAADPVTGVAPVLPGIAPEPATSAATSSRGGTTELPIPGPYSSPGSVKVTDITTRKETVTRESLAIKQAVTIPEGTPPFLVPNVTTIPKPKVFSLSQLRDEDFEQVGKGLAANPDEVLRRSRLEVVVGSSGKLEVHPVPAADKVLASVPELDLQQGESALVDAILNLNLVAQTVPEKNAARRLVAAFVRGLGTDADRRLSAFFTTALETIRQILVARYHRAPSENEVEVTERVLTVSRLNVRPITKNLYEVVDRNYPVAYEGWAHSLVPIEWFDSDTERQMAVLLDESAHILRWVRLHQSDNVAIRYLGHNYFPDFVAEAKDGVHWLIETKADFALADQQVLTKKDAAEDWARYASDFLAPRTWRYVLVAEKHLANAKGNWEVLLAQAGAAG